MKFNSSIGLKIFASILVIFILCGFVVIAQDQDSEISENTDQSSLSTSFNEPAESQQPVEQINQEIYVNIDEIQPILAGDTVDAIVEKENLEVENNSLSVFTENISDILNSSEENNSLDEVENSTDSSDSLKTVENSLQNDLDSSDYDYVDLKEILNQYQSLQNSSSEKNEELEKTSEKEVTYVLYEGNKKEIETQTAENTGLVINVDENIIEEPNWEKEVTISSNKHHENPVTAYSDISEDVDYKEIKVFWKEEQKNLDYETFDTNGNGIVDRISWIVPHLSEQNFLITLQDTNSTNDTGQILIVSPSFNSNITSSSIVLPFLINNTLGATTNCNFSLFKSGNLINTSVDSSASINYNLSVDNGLYNWNMSCTDSLNSLYNYSLGSFAVSVNNTPKITFTSNVSAALKNSTVGFAITINASAGPLLYTVDWADGSNLFNSTSVNSSFITNTLSHLYQSSGNYVVKLTVFAGGISYEKTLNLAIVSISSIVDNTDPSINLISPEDGENVLSTSANFTYFVSDNVYVSNCTMSVYYYQSNNPLGVLVHSQTDKTVNNKSISVIVDDLSSGNYSWDVGCYDNSSNYNERNNDFEISNSNVYATYSEPELNLSSGDQAIVNDINSLIEKINNFLTKEDSYGPEEKEAIADLGLDDKINGYKKILIQNKLDVSYNLGFIRDDILRENRKNEIRDNLVEMDKEVPIDLSVSDSYDYYKTESKSDIENVIQEMLKLNGLSVNEGTLASMVAYLQSLQEIGVTSNNAKNVRIEYDDKTEDITLVRKDIELQNNSFDFFIENVPRELSHSNVVFITKAKSLGNQYFQIQAADFNGESIVYYIEDKVELKDMEKTSIVLFSEEVLTLKPIAGITGFVTSFSIQNYGAAWPYLIGFLFVSMLIFGGTYYTRQTGMVRMAEQNNEFRIVIDKLESASRFVKLKDFESAKSEYRVIKEKYSELPEDARKIAYQKIKDLQVDLDRKEAIELVKEFISSVQQGRKEDARLIYNKIKAVYPRLPEEDRKKGYDKIAPYVSLLNSR